MWQQVDATNLAQLQQVVDVLKAHDDNSWPTAQDLQQWIEGRDVQFFYYPGAGYQLTVGFERDDHGWRLRTGGAAGSLVQASGQQMAAKVVEFMQAEGLTELPMYSFARSASDPNQVLLESGLQLLRQHPQVAEIRRRTIAFGRRRYDIVLQ